MRILAFGSTVQKVLFGVFRALRVDSEGRAEIVANIASIAGVNTQRFIPYDGGGQSLDIGAAADRSSALTIGEVYHITGEENCYIVAGNSSVDATTADYFLPSGLVVEYVPTVAGDQYISCIRDDTDSVAGLHISRAS